MDLVNFRALATTSDRFCACMPQINFEPSCAALTLPCSILSEVVPFCNFSFDVVLDLGLPCPGLLPISLQLTLPNMQTPVK
jgi:hypothetical protein